MYNFIVSCYYWPAAEGRLRLRSLQIRTNRRRRETGLNYSQVARLTCVDNSAASIERRNTIRIKVGCDAELTANLSILDSEAYVPAESLVFLGRTVDLSSEGLSLVLPSIQIDERYCVKSTRIQLSLHLPKRTVSLEVSPVRCVPLDEEDTALGYLIGAQIVSFDDNKADYDEYLRAIANLALET